MNRMIRTAFIAVMVWGIGAAATAAAPSVPALTARVNDYAGKLTDSEKANLETMLANAEAQSSNQIAILIVPSLEGDSIEDYAQRVFTTWKLGQKKLDNGVLIVWAPAERKMRIHVGYGLEGKLTDAVCFNILHRELGPNLKAGNYYAGLRQTVASILLAVKGEYKASPGAQASGAPALFTNSQLALMMLFGIITFVFACMGMKFGTVAGGVSGVLLGLFGWGGLMAVVVWAVIGLVVGALMRPILDGMASGSDGSWGGDGSSSSDSGGWSGGGGDSGGGGASDSY
ncbi:MAG TPA: TPM domain-containing protein [Candidatus Paceibacterota bacterium]|nr:TPM domain-containing protein [Candidatus Paceibacterota bacterium]